MGHAEVSRGAAPDDPALVQPFFISLREKQRAMDAVKAELRAEQSRRDETMNMQRQLANMAMQRKLDQVVLSVAPACVPT